MRHVMALILLLGSVFPAAAAEKYVFDKSHTNIMWFASHFGFSDSMGQFMEYDGHILLDRDTPENSAVEVNIHTASVMTGLEKFDAHLKSGDFFDVDTFPLATFKSTRVDVIDRQHAKVLGDFTLLGKTHPLLLQVTLNKIGVNPYNQKQTAGFDVSATLKRSEFGMDYALPGVGDEVKLQIKAEAVLAAPEESPENAE